MALVLAADVVERFFGMWTGTITYDAMETASTRPTSSTRPRSPASRRSPSPTTRWRAKQHLVYRGVLVERGEAAPGADVPGSGGRRRLYERAARLGAADGRGLLRPEPAGAGRLPRARPTTTCSSPPPAGADEADRRTIAAARRLVEAFLPVPAGPAHRPGGAVHRGRRAPGRDGLVAALVTEPALLADRLLAGRARCCRRTGPPATGA